MDWKMNGGKMFKFLGIEEIANTVEKNYDLTMAKKAQMTSLQK